MNYITPAAAAAEIDLLKQQILEMADDIRQMDQLVYKISQCLTLDEIQPYLAELVRLTRTRMRAESDRITDVMRKELISVYAPRIRRPK
jgi:hypothetical protein